ncbi:MAG: glycosyltransferase family 9 protein [Chloroflexi bacterium]|nr:glycosyltransferase family 9 protein [Chloroflexota bacterium]
MALPDPTGAWIYFSKEEKESEPWLPDRLAVTLVQPVWEGNLPVRMPQAFPLQAAARPLLVKPDPLEPGIRSVAVLAGAGIGEFLSVLPALQSLRSAYPQVEMTLLGTHWQAGFLAGRPSPIDRVLVVREDEKPAAWQQPDRDDPLSGERFDLALQFCDTDEQAVDVLQRLHARLSAGVLSPLAPQLDRWVPYDEYQPDVMRYLEVVSLLGVETGAVKARLSLVQRDFDELEPYLSVDERYAVLVPGTQDPRRRWPVDKFSAVARALTWAGLKVVLAGEEKDQALSRAVLHQTAFDALDLTGRLSLGGLAALMRRASVVIACDSWPLQLARAVDAPTVGIYWCANLLKTGPPTRLHNRVLVSWRLNCPVCGLNVNQSGCEHQASFMDEVSRDEVLAAALELSGSVWGEIPLGSPHLALEAQGD